jgi:hypothetical protein
MDSVRIYFKVQDFLKWKQAFDEDVNSGQLERAGVTKYDLQHIINTGETSLYFELESADQFKEFVNSDANQKRMKDAGIIGTPRFEYMKRLEEKRLGGASEKAA